MRGLPSCGKSHTARRLAGETGVVCETDAYFYSHVGDDPAFYDYDGELLPAARRWNRECFRAAVDAGRSPIVVDRGNSLSVESQRYVRLAMAAGYEVDLTEPDSPWWQEIRVLLKYKQHTKPVLLDWSRRLAEMSRSTHRVSAVSIRRRMSAWKHDLTIQDILDFEPGDAAAGGDAAGEGTGDGAEEGAAEGAAGGPLSRPVGRASRGGPGGARGDRG